ncbi:hypothetical protein [Actinomyces ruminis]|uniref:hypothetical protein n=1 Tax=Actinomyces ruminis TaxID=1937003 RepID=UPI0011784091|nr:hypothetical protein [Actinomyces ruminis]
MGTATADAGPENPHAQPPAGSADGEATAPADTDPITPGSADPAPTPVDDTDPDAAPLATVHRLRPLPQVPSPASPPAADSSGAVESARTPGAATGMSAGSPDPAPADAPEGARSHRLAPVAWDAPAQTFSDGVPLPEEPGDPDGPEDLGLQPERRGCLPPRRPPERLPAAEPATTTVERWTPAAPPSRTTCPARTMRTPRKPASSGWKSSNASWAPPFWRKSP